MSSGNVPWAGGGVEDEQRNWVMSVPHPGARYGTPTNGIEASRVGAEICRHALSTRPEQCPLSGLMSDAPSCPRGPHPTIDDTGDREHGKEDTDTTPGMAYRVRLNRPPFHVPAPHWLEVTSTEPSASRQCVPGMVKTEISAE